MRVYVVSYSIDTDEDGEAEVLCVKRNLSDTFAVYAERSPADRLAAEMRMHYPDLTYNVTEVDL